MKIFILIAILGLLFGCIEPQKIATPSLPDIEEQSWQFKDCNMRFSIYSYENNERMTVEVPLGAENNTTFISENGVELPSGKIANKTHVLIDLIKNTTSYVYYNCSNTERHWKGSGLYISDFDNDTPKYEIGEFLTCGNGTRPVDTTCECAKNTTSPCMMACFKCVEKERRD